MYPGIFNFLSVLNEYGNMRTINTHHTYTTKSKYRSVEAVYICETVCTSLVLKDSMQFPHIPFFIYVEGGDDM
jgi:hypothetical protein